MQVSFCPTSSQISWFEGEWGGGSVQKINKKWGRWMQNEAVKTWHVWKVPDWELNIISPYLRTFHRKKYRGWIPLNPDFRCANEKKKRKYICKFSPLPLLWPNTIFLCGADESGDNFVGPTLTPASTHYYNISLQCGLQELRLCLSSINHFMVTGGGPPATQPPLPTDLGVGGGWGDDSFPLVSK